MQGSHPITLSRSPSLSSDSSNENAKTGAVQPSQEALYAWQAKAAEAASEAASKPEQLPCREEYTSSQLAYLRTTGLHPDAPGWAPHRFVSAGNMPRAKKKGRGDKQRLHQQSEVFRALSRAVLNASTAAGHLEQYDCLDDHPSIPLGEIGKHGRGLQ
jgi:hypothetical protein